MSYRCPQPTANSGRERRKAQVDRRFQLFAPAAICRLVLSNSQYSTPPYCVSSAAMLAVLTSDGTSQRGQANGGTAPVCAPRVDGWLNFF